MSEIPKTPEPLLNLENLKPGTWTYLLPLFNPRSGYPEELSAEEVAAQLNNFWPEIDNKNGEILVTFPWLTEKYVDSGGVCGPVKLPYLLITIRIPK